MFVFGVVSIEVWKTDLPVWGFVLALLICMFCLTLIFPSLTVAVYFSIRVYCSYWYNPSHYEPTSWAQRHHGANHRIRPSWPSDCDDDVQDMGLYYHDSGTEFCVRSQARTLHEDCASPDVLLSGRLYRRRRHRATRGASVDVLQYRGPLLLETKRRLHLPIDHRVRYRINYCKFSRVACFFVSVAQYLFFDVVVGCDRTTASVLARSALLWPRLLFPCGLHCTINPVDIT